MEQRQAKISRNAYSTERKTLTQKFPFLLPMRVAQRKAFFYTGMLLDNHIYAKTMQDELLQHTLFFAKNELYNANTGFDMVYQENKVFNLKLVAKMLNGLLIKPGETFSFWQLVRYADKNTAYKDGLVVKNGKVCVAKAGGLCQMSNILFWVFLHSPLVIVERHTHRKNDFPTQRDEEPEGVDATISEGWLDLKVKNETDRTFQIGLSFDSDNIHACLYTDKPMPFQYEIEGKELSYFRKNDTIYQEISIYRRELERETKKVVKEDFLYKNSSVIGYSLPNDTIIKDGVK
jgi:vancomycin resistance protein VanW